jgi:hypothetical protein
LRADHQAGAQRARQRDTFRDEHCNPKAPHKGLIHDFLEHPSLLALDLTPRQNSSGGKAPSQPRAKLRP